MRCEHACSFVLIIITLFIVIRASSVRHRGCFSCNISMLMTFILLRLLLPISVSCRLVAEHEYAGPDCVLDRSCPSQGNNPAVLYHATTSIDRCVEDNDGSIYSSLGPGQLATVARGRAPVPDSSGKYDKKEESVDSIGAAEAAIGPLFLGALGVRGTRARGRTRRPPAARAPSLSAPTAQTTQ